jgi:hypothetical protein
MARVVNGRPAPVDVWLTEMGVSPPEVGVPDRAAGQQLKSKFCLRTVLFYLGAGAARVYLFNALGDSSGHALVDAAAPDTPTEPLRLLARALNLIRGTSGSDDYDTPLTRLTFAVYPSGIGTEPIFFGGGDPPMPSLRSADCLVLLPFQSAPARIAIAYYVMTRDVRVTRAPEQIRMQVGGITGNNARIQTFDPVDNLEVPCVVEERGPDRMILRIEASDSPRILIFSDLNK